MKKKTIYDFTRFRTLQENLNKNPKSLNSQENYLLNVLIDS